MTTPAQTPRTDAETHLFQTDLDSSDGCSTTRAFVLADFARTLERDLAAERALADVHAEALTTVMGYGSSDMGHQQMCDYVTEVAAAALARHADARKAGHEKAGSGSTAQAGPNH